MAEIRKITRAEINKEAIWDGLSLRRRLKILAVTALNTSNQLPRESLIESPRALGLFRSAPAPLLPPDLDPESDDDDAFRNF